MSSFPYNKPSGSPFDFEQAHEIAYELFWWHSQIADSDDWTQSASGAEGQINDIALGLMDMFAQAAFVRMLDDVGTAVRRRLDTIRVLREHHGEHEMDDVLRGLKLLPPSDE